MIKALLLDTDGVLVNAEMFSKQLAKDYNIEPHTLLPFFKNEFQNCLVGKADLKKEVEPFLKTWGWTGSVDELLSYWFQAEHKLDEPLVAYVQILRKQGTPCYVATNQEKYRTEYLLSKMGFRDSFDDVFSSAHIGHKKPQKEFYLHIVNKLDLNPSEILYFDDDESNIQGAKDLGINAYMYNGIEDLKQKVTEEMKG